MAPADASLVRRLGVVDATVIGIGSMVGAGVFVVWAPAAEAAGTALLIGLVIAAVVAICNASSSAQLAAVHPESGGTYVYAGRELGGIWGFAAGGSFVVGKLASCSAGALALGAYLWPGHERTVAVAAIVVITAVNLGGLSRTVRVTMGILVVSAVALGLVIASAAFDTNTTTGALNGGSVADALRSVGPAGVLESAGLLFFAFAGYARIATLGEEVRDPATTIMRAVPLALGAVLVIYALVAVSTLAVLPIETLIDTPAPLRAVIEQGPLSGFAPLIGLAAATAAFGVLLNLVPGISRTVLAMARQRDLPAWWATVSPTRSLPVRAEVSTAAVAIMLVLTTDLRGSIALSGVAVLWYYALTNAAALRLGPDRRRWPVGFAVIGLIGCLVLAFSLPLTSILLAAGALVAGLAVRTLSRNASGH